MNVDLIVRAVTFATAFAALYAAHMVADHWVQTQHQADHKGITAGRPAGVSHWNCFKHVATYTATAAIALAGALLWLGLPARPGWVVAGLLVSAASHYLADLRAPLRWIADRIGSGGFYRVNTGGVSGAYLLDQSWHIGWLFVAALLIAGP